MPTAPARPPGPAQPRGHVARLIPPLEAGLLSAAVSCLEHTMGTALRDPPGEARPPVLSASTQDGQRPL